ncbi:2,3-bisphosphoglycerate-independent phosphoglycerate mutase [Clostridium luticellarii]|uniref:2,3-bisphosphoglycerate-independent phosphoglycerate mutase n=1 Tax=Clostridium luticellarii TaxID=1691940 RepID=A0A2T0BLC3_9CLOT|nr:2,3-bisphosphoglycerate-independent phosphoglycerate mutase [Clostridium luticellarii]MCI1945400.1 2,3-bisphosphoglycerate-independent phosphoglycerate mutase [Clostridium luticellarii]MCI1968735.1 2,3-bisphosphoglycerate-independent phosphoglycerate mutase [Clostridium luticellarii]MCI1994910.1 2,3-bisphosphoglycerate-independent phosphoglycerate mutase [Clostridium luticellarii]MCI2040161.1 2,3-bisphosphoglycerate-independent phosphoglycerate mutase [Clostridium luticellarii]PRR84694.1 2,
MKKNPVMLMILDGFGISEKKQGNAVKAAYKPNIDSYLMQYPHTELSASGKSVGLPEGQMGNSEVGHLNIGSGRIVYQDLSKITKSIENGEFFKNTALNKAMDNVIENDSDLHLMGLVSPGGVHSHMDHLKGILQFAKKKHIGRVYIHAFTDGRDVPPSSAGAYIKDINQYMAEIGVGSIATISGRYYAMDRDKRWERVQLAYNALVYGTGNKAGSALEAIENSYENGVTDEFIVPTVIETEGKPAATIKNGDSVIFFNFRPDRARQLTRAIIDDSFKAFKRNKLNLEFVTMTEYDATIENVDVAFQNEYYKNTLGEYVSNMGKNQLRIAETEKYAHVTFFFNGGVEVPNKNEDRVLIPSPKVATYDLKPEMSAREVTSQLLNRLDMDKYDMIILNFANPDMVGHTGIFEAAKTAVEVVDECVGKIVNKVLEKQGTVFITADHGNCEQMMEYSTKKPMTAHTTNKVPFIYISRNAVPLRRDGILADIAPTMLEVMGLSKPEEMTGKSLILK